MIPAALALVLVLVLVGAVLVLVVAQRHATGIVEDNLLRMEQIHLDFSAQGERPTPPVPGGAGPMVLFFHETAADGGSVEKYLGFLGAPYRVWAPHFREPEHIAEARGLGIFCVPELVEQARDYLRQAAELAGDDPLVLVGVSRGAGLATLAIQAEPEVRVDGVVLESFFSPRDTLAAKVKRFAPIYLGARLASLVPDWFLRFCAGLGLTRVEKRLGVNFLETDVAAVDLSARVLFVHGGRDPAAPVSAVRGYVAARHGAGAGQTSLEVFDKARHNAASQAEPERYRQVIQGFLAEVTQSATRAEESAGGGVEA